MRNQIRRSLRQLALVAGCCTVLLGCGALASGVIVFFEEWERWGTIPVGLAVYLAAWWPLTFLVGVGAYRYGRRDDDNGLLLVAFSTILLVPLTMLADWSMGRLVVPVALGAILTLLLAALSAVTENEANGFSTRAVDRRSVDG